MDTLTLLFRNERKKLLLSLVIGAVGYPVQWELMQYGVRSRLLNGNSIGADRQLHFPRFGTALALTQLLRETQLPYGFFYYFYT